MSDEPKLVNTSALDVVVPKPDDTKPLRLDLGCGPNKNKQGEWFGVDVLKFEGVDLVLNLVEREPFTPDPAKGYWEQVKPPFKKWPWADGSVEEIHSSHFIEHLHPDERVHFVNEAHRVLKPAGKAVLIAPNWSSMRAYGDMTHKWPPVAAFWFFYLSKEWRKTNAPHNEVPTDIDYTCDFSPGWGFSIRGDVQVRNQEYQMFAMNNYIDVCEDVICTLTAIK